MGRAWARLNARPAMFETCVLSLVTMVDTFWTLYLVKAGYAVEANPGLAWALQVGTPMFLALKLFHLVPAIVAFEWLRGLNPSFAKLAAKVSMWGYIAFYVLASVRLHGLL